MAKIIHLGTELVSRWGVEDEEGNAQPLPPHSLPMLVRNRTTLEELYRRSEAHRAKLADQPAEQVAEMLRAAERRAWGDEEPAITPVPVNGQGAGAARRPVRVEE